MLEVYGTGELWTQRYHDLGILDGKVVFWGSLKNDIYQ